MARRKCRFGANFSAKEVDTAAGAVWLRSSLPFGSQRRTAVVLVHGVVVSGRYMSPVAEELEAGFPVLVPDLPGYGRSKPPPAPPSLADLADAAVGAAQAVGYDRVALVGNSFGAQIAVEAALRHPQAVERVALIGLTTHALAPSRASSGGGCAARATKTSRCCR